MSRFLFDTHLLLWAAEGDRRLSRRAVDLMEDGTAKRMFSPVSVAEVAIKFVQGRPDFTFAPDILRDGLLENGYDELALTGKHALGLLDLPPIHKDPWDRLLVAQALAEGVPFVTADAALAGYPGRIVVV